MATEDEVRDAVLAARLALAEKAGKALPDNALKFAEAYAWLSAPGESHGGGPKP